MSIKICVIKTSSSLAKQVTEVIWYEFLRPHKFIPRKVSNTRPSLRSWGTEDLEDELKLMYLVVTLKYRFLREQFKHYTPRRQCEPFMPSETNEFDVPCAPHVDLWPIYGCAEKQFGGPIPQRDYTVGIVTSPALVIESCETEITKFQLATVVDQDI
jgi:hypothetical protein